MRLANKTAVVTGAGTGIGHATALLFAKEGARVVVHSRSEENAKRTAAELEAAGGFSAIAVAGSLDAPETSDRLASVARERFGGLDILVNNAGIDNFDPVCVVSPETWNLVLGVNLNGTFLASRALLPLLRPGGGSIVNVASASALIGSPGMAAYTASKGAIVSLTRQMAVDYAADQLRVNSICPGSVDTPMLREGLAASPDPQEVLRRRTELHPIGRIGTANDVAYGILYLASDEAAFVTGANLVIDGGLTIS